MDGVTICFIGGGNMAGSLAGGLISDDFPAEHIWVSNPSTAKLERLHAQFGVQTTHDNVEAVKQADVVVFSVKPNVVPTIAKELKETIQARQPLVISVAAGVRATDIAKWLGNGVSIVRCMPNTPALIGAGATALYANRHVTDAQRELAESILRAVGLTVWLDDEAQIDIVTALSGSGPAYFFLAMEALQDTAIELGLSAADARLLTVQTALGAARMALETQVGVGELREQVTSPGGTTEKALNVLHDADVAGSFRKALMGARERAVELADQLGKE